MGGGQGKPDVQHLLKSRAQRIIYAISVGTGVDRDSKTTKIENWLKRSTPEQLEVLDAALDSFDSLSGQERFIIGSSLEPLTYLSGPTGVIHEVLALREAFASQWAVTSRPGEAVGNFDAYVLGLRKDNHKTPLDCSDEQAVRENIALLRFAFEMNKRTPFGASYNPVREARVGVERFAFEYADDKLREFIRSHHEQVGRIIDLALDHQTCDPQRLEALLAYGGPQSIAAGTL